MSFSDERFAYGPFVPHWIPKQYIENYFSSHGTDRFLVLNTTVENVTRIAGANDGRSGWNLTLRRHDPIKRVDSWWEEQFDSLIIGNGHYSVPFVSHTTIACTRDGSLRSMLISVDSICQGPR